MIDPMLSWQCPLIFLSSSHLWYRNTQCFVMAMPVNMIIAMYVILCILSYDFSKLPILYIHVYISLLFL